MKNVVISILTHNKKNYTTTCLDKLFRNTNYSETPFTLVITDNNSTDGTKEFLKSLKDKIIFIDNKENLGFSKAHNKVILEYQDSDIVLLNNDIEVPENWLLTLQYNAFLNKYGCVSPAIHTECGLDVGAVLDKKANGRSLINDFSTEPDWITGSCIYIRKETISKIGVLDENFRFYYEDVDYCFKMKKENIKFKCIKDVVVIHHNSVSSNPFQKRRMLEESRIYFAKKWGYEV